MRNSALLLFALLALASPVTVAQDDSKDEPFTVKAPAGWTVTTPKMLKGTGRQLVHTKARVQLTLHHLTMEEELNEKDKETAKKPGMLAASFILPTALKIAKKAGSKSMLVYDRVGFAGTSAAGARVIIPVPARGGFVTIHGVALQRGKQIFLAMISHAGRVDHVEEGQVHHDAINQAYAMLQGLKLKTGE